MASTTSTTTTQLMFNYMASVTETTRLKEQHKLREQELQRLYAEYDYIHLQAQQSSFKSSIENLYRKNTQLTDDLSSKSKENNNKQAHDKRNYEKEIQMLKQQLEQQKRQHTNALDKSSREAERGRQKLENEKKILESRIDSLKTKIKSLETRSPQHSQVINSRPSSTFSPMISKKQPTMKHYSPLRKSTFSTTPFLKKTSVLDNTPKDPKKSTAAAAAAATTFSKPIVTTNDNDKIKNNKQRSLFDDSDDEADSKSKSKSTTLNKRGKVKLRASKSAFDDDDDNDQSWFTKTTTKSLQPDSATNTETLFSPLKKSNQQLRSQFKV